MKNYYLRSIIAFALASIMVCLIVQRASDLDLIADRVSDRYALMVLPVCISNLYHGHRHDFTAYQEIRTIANHYRYTEIGGNYRPEMARAIQPMLDAKITNPQATMFWGYDDRGLADYCIASFSLFGPSIASLSKFWLVLLAISAAAFLMTYARHPTGPPILLLFLVCAYLGLGLYSFLQTAASLSEERTFEYLSYLPALHLALFPFFVRKVNRLAIIGLALQTLMFVLLYHARSSVGWQLLPIIASPLALAFKHRSALINFRKKESGAWPKIIFMPLAMLIVCMCTLSVYKHITYNPAYFGEQGGRNFYHNALMGLHGMSYPGEPRLAIDDNLVKRNVQTFIARQRGIPVEKVVYASQFGATYEADAKQYYFYLIMKDPIGTFIYYIKSKLVGSLGHLWSRSAFANNHSGSVRVGDAMHKMNGPGVLEYVKSKNLLFAPLVTPISLFAIIVAVLFSSGSTEGIRPTILIASVFFVAGLIPSTLFYNQDMRQLTGAMLSAGLFLHLASYWFLAVFWRKLSPYIIHDGASPNIPHPSNLSTK